MADTRLPKRSMLLTEEVPELDPQAVNADDEDDDLVESNQCSFSLLYSDDELATANEADHSGSRNGPDFTNLSSSLTDAIVSSPSSSSNSVDESSLTRLSEARPNTGCITSGNARAKHDRRTAKQLTERKRRDRINALLDTLRSLILRLLRKNQYNGTVPPNSDTTVPLSALTNNRRPLGSIENMNRILPYQFTPMQTILGSGRSPMKELRQAQKAFTPVGAYARAFIGSDRAHKARPVNNENEGNYSHLKNVLNSTSSQSLWRPYI
ncbi:hypothetical protein FGIG_00402 [Fasciola gigantica]|uniref:BHLH domain-containing protein n=1 Tax=Fasciola gigantica TaxID=46835 RepID=A0A504Z5L1_FASGI|nr:hypothetical protein FGIG_00402 [Fasciola gigantica]